ncbi:GTPase-activating protein gyp7-like [Canna indica]|uniref:GTPase-activating protein gyp7-like n=1 Tax=Canna indica TaxID=4628 RepID=A0AAQ3K0B0_9LILI|nr:GTPase-activating protein gyp7-like [Canna indica]
MSALRRSDTSSSSSPHSSSPKLSWIHLRSLLIVASSPAPDRGSLRSPWSRRKRKHALTINQWTDLFTSDGKLRDGGRKFLKKVRSAGIDPSIRAEVWPFLLGIYNLKSSEAERNVVRSQKRKEYEKLRRQCRRLLNPIYEGDNEFSDICEMSYTDSPSFIEQRDSLCIEEVLSARESLSIERGSPHNGILNEASSTSNLVIIEEDDKRGLAHADASADVTDSSDSDDTDEEPESFLMSPATSGHVGTDSKLTKIASFIREIRRSDQAAEDFATWQRIMRLDAIRANAEWIIHSPAQAAVSKEKAIKCAIAVGLKDYDHLEPCRIYHAARLVAILEAYAIYDPEIGYCQGMSDLLSPILAVMEEDHQAFWCFVGFMRKARHNFRLDEAGIRRQLNTVSKIIKSKDSHLYRHLEKLQAEDCFFVYRMVVVIFRRELTFEQTLCLWEVMWADQAAIRAGIGKSVWGRIRLRAPPTDDLLLYAIAASVLQRKKLIIEKYSSMDEIMRECNSMAGQLDVWKLLDDAHDLVVTLHDKIR